MIFPFWSIPSIAAILWIARFLEKRYPVESEQPNAEIIMDWKLAAIRIGMDQLIAPLTAASGIMILNVTGGGWFQLRSDGWWFLLSVIIMILATDFLTYLLHRAEHKLPVLWAMHSLHHSAEALSIITGARHFWLEDAINTIAFSVLGIVFKVPPEVATSVAFLYLLPCGLAHLNLRLSLGRFALVLNNPQYHRIHHSVEPQHRDKNFCQMLPLFDVIFGTAWKPGKDEFPMTGLVPRERANGILDGLIWPFRRRLPWARDRTAEAVIARSSLSANSKSLASISAASPSNDLGVGDAI
jgi:sterol desaturase/sphingolipid hydroxylase (fatty acid hydroxylase superfamily)